jgi:hypothetical protein
MRGSRAHSGPTTSCSGAGDPATPRYGNRCTSAKEPVHRNASHPDGPLQEKPLQLSPRRRPAFAQDAEQLPEYLLACWGKDKAVHRCTHTERQAEARRRKPMTIKSKQDSKPPAIPPLPPASGSVIPLKDILGGFAAELWAIQRQMVRGCGNHGCRVNRPTGMATNDRCRCTPRDFAQRLRDIADRLSPNRLRAAFTCHPHFVTTRSRFSRNCVDVCLSVRRETRNPIHVPVTFCTRSIGTPTARLSTQSITPLAIDPVRAHLCSLDVLQNLLSINGKQLRM